MRRRLDPDRKVDYSALVRKNFEFLDHIQRTYMTGASIAFTEAKTLCDPAVGDGSVVEAAYRIRPDITMAYLSDLSLPNIERLQVTFPHKKGVADIKSAITHLPEHVDLIVLTEILEHLENPDEIVALAREKADWLVASSPIEEPEGVVNPEHLWSFGRQGYRDMLRYGGWKPFSYAEVGFPDDPALYYTFQIWVCK